MRNWQRRSSATTCALLAVVWLNVAFQACAMAAAPMDDCPHCPTGMHHGEMPMAPMAPMATMDCDLLDQFDDPDALGTFVKLASDLDGLTFITSSLPPSVQAIVAIATARSPDESPPSVHGPPRNILFCTYLN
jgi:hypothetical protein